MKRIAPLALAAFSLAFSLALATPAEADRRSERPRVEHRRQDLHENRRQRIEHRRQDHRRHDRYDRRDRRHDSRHQRFDIPRRIHRQQAHRYDSYFDGYSYFAPHRHRHSVYRFPIYHDGSWSYRSRFYCEGELFDGHGSIGYHGRRFSIRLGF